MRCLFCSAFPLSRGWCECLCICYDIRCTKCASRVKRFEGKLFSAGVKSKGNEGKKEKQKTGTEEEKEGRKSKEKEENKINILRKKSKEKK